MSFIQLYNKYNNIARSNNCQISFSWVIALEEFELFFEGHSKNMKKITRTYFTLLIQNQSLEVVRVDAERNLLLVKGAVPGATGGNLVVRPAAKARG